MVVVAEIKYSVCPHPFMGPREAIQDKGWGKGWVRGCKGCLREGKGDLREG